MEAGLPQRLFTVDEFHRLAEARILGGQERLELLDGLVIEMAAIGSRHAACVRRLLRLLGDHLPEACVLDVQNPVYIDDRTELVPDLSVLRARADFYATAHPRPDDLLLLIEVADTTLHYDRGVKIRRYGSCGIGEVWLVDLQNRRIEVFRGPSQEGYRESRWIDDGSLSPLAFPDLVLCFDDLLG